MKGKSALVLSRDFNVQYKTSFMLSHKLREATASVLKGTRLSGARETLKVEGGHFGGYIKAPNAKKLPRSAPKRRIGILQSKSLMHSRAIFIGTMAFGLGMTGDWPEDGVQYGLVVFERQRTTGVVLGRLDAAPCRSDHAACATRPHGCRRHLAAAGLLGA